MSERVTMKARRRAAKLSPDQHKIRELSPSAIGWDAETWSYLNPTTRDVYVRVTRHGQSVIVNFSPPRCR